MKPALSSTLESDRVTAIAEATPGEIWIGTYGDGIVAVDSQTGSTRRIRHHADTPTSLYDDYVYALFRDRSGLMWISDFESALSQHDPRERASLPSSADTGRPEGISGKKVFVVTPMPDGRVWLGVNGGIDIIDPVLGRCGQIVPDPTHPGELVAQGTRAGHRARRGRGLIATQQGLYRSDRNGQHIAQVTVPGRSPTSAARELCLVGEVLWLGGDEDGLWAVGPACSIDKPVVRSACIRVPAWGRTRSQHRPRRRYRALGRHAQESRACGCGLRLGMSACRWTQPTPTQLLGCFCVLHPDGSPGRLWVASFGYGIAGVGAARRQRPLALSPLRPA